MYNKSCKILALFFLWGLFPQLKSFAQNLDYPWSLKASYSILQYSGELENQYFNPAKRNDGASLAFTRFLNPSFDLNLGFDYQRMSLSGVILENIYYSKGNIFSPSFGVLYKFNNNYLLPESSRIKPYIGLGANYLAGKTSGIGYELKGDNFSHFVDEIALNLTLGLKTKVIGKIDFFVEVNSLLTTTEEFDGAAIDIKNDKYAGAKIGFSIRLGGPKDSDGDGVTDDKDECPDTPFGVKVDEKGCPLDKDLDGIPDYQDDCPDIPGLPEFNGCPDSDGDGIMDKEDDCPDLPGLPEYNGCPDSDGDGVIDPKDLCPDTPMGVKVDEHGCPIDSDGDGLTDDIDQCPDEYGPMEYMGCPEPPDVGWPSNDREMTPEVYFETDKYDLTPEAEVEVQKLVKFMIENPNMNIRLYGFADPRGTKEYNDVLSARRVDAVKKYLMRKGIPESRIAVRALGEIQEVKSRIGQEDLPLDEKYKSARKVQFETFFFMR